MNEIDKKALDAAFLYLKIKDNNELRSVRYNYKDTINYALYKLGHKL